MALDPKRKSEAPRNTHRKQSYYLKALLATLVLLTSILLFRHIQTRNFAQSNLSNRSTPKMSSMKNADGTVNFDGVKAHLGHLKG